MKKHEKDCGQRKGDSRKSGKKDKWAAAWATRGGGKAPGNKASIGGDQSLIAAEKSTNQGKRLYEALVEEGQSTKETGGRKGGTR